MALFLLEQMSVPWSTHFWSRDSVVMGTWVVRSSNLSIIHVYCIYIYIIYIYSQLHVFAAVLVINVRWSWGKAASMGRMHVLVPVMWETNGSLHCSSFGIWWTTGWGSFWGLSGSIVGPSIVCLLLCFFCIALPCQAARTKYCEPQLCNECLREPRLGS